MFWNLPFGLQRAAEAGRMVEESLHGSPERLLSEAMEVEPGGGVSVSIYIA